MSNTPTTPFDWSPHPLDWQRAAGVLFDLDGVITPTALVHERAWKALFDWFLEQRGADHDVADRSPFTVDDYLRYVDGKPRYLGVRSFLESRGVHLPEGTPDDEPGHETVCALGNRKNIEFNQIIEVDGVDAYPGSLALLDHLDSLGVAQAIVSSSKNAVPVLAAAGLGGRFEIIVDGLVSAELGLHGKPAPDAFLLGAERLGSTRRRRSSSKTPPRAWQPEPPVASAW
ncbi:MAG: HAD hydrolase-like protein [Acidimicrobiales bacterium]